MKEERHSRSESARDIDEPIDSTGEPRLCRFRKVVKGAGPRLNPTPTPPLAPVYPPESPPNALAETNHAADAEECLPAESTGGDPPTHIVSSLTAPNEANDAFGSSLRS